MMWKPNVNIHPETSDDEKREMMKQAIDEVYDIPRHPVSDTTQFIISSTTIDKQKLHDPRFSEQFENEILSIDKFAPLSNIDEIDMQLTRLIWMDIIFAKRMGMDDRAKRKSLEIVRLYNESRGRTGFFQKALITQRQELMARQEQNEQQNKGRLGFFRRKPQPSEQMMQMQQGGG